MVNKKLRGVGMVGSSKDMLSDQDDTFDSNRKWTRKRKGKEIRC